jgi:hypothetical protein
MPPIADQTPVMENIDPSGFPIGDQEAAIRQSQRECEQAERIRQVIGNREILIGILSRLPGVDPSDIRFSEFLQLGSDEIPVEHMG